MNGVRAEYGATLELEKEPNGFREVGASSVEIIGPQVPVRERIMREASTKVTKVTREAKGHARGPRKRDHLPDARSET